MFDDFEERFGPKCVGDIVFANEQRRDLIEDLITVSVHFPSRKANAASCCMASQALARVRWRNYCLMP